MAWNDDPEHPFSGIAERLKRADENIVNLKTEIDTFIQSGKYPILPKQNTKAWKEASDYHRDKPIPLRFSVLAGEVAHHMRSCLDHVIWHFSRPNLTPQMESAIAFPIFEIEPKKTKEIEQYERKIQGITNTNVLGLIKDMQPYQTGADVADHALLIIHNMDRFDKHRELVIVGSSIDVVFPPDDAELRAKAKLYAQSKLTQPDQLTLSRALKDYKAAPGIAFKEFGNYRPYPVFIGLAQLLAAVDTTVDAFASEV